MPSQQHKITVHFFKPSGKWAYTGWCLVSEPNGYLAVLDVEAKILEGELEDYKGSNWDGPIMLDMGDHPAGCPACYPHGTLDIQNRRRMRAASA